MGCLLPSKLQRHVLSAEVELSIEGAERAHGVLVAHEGDMGVAFADAIVVLARVHAARQVGATKGSIGAEQGAELRHGHIQRQPADNQHLATRNDSRLSVPFHAGHKRHWLQLVERHRANESLVLGLIGWRGRRRRQVEHGHLLQRNSEGAKKGLARGPAHGRGSDGVGHRGGGGDSVGVCLIDEKQGYCFQFFLIRRPSKDACMLTGARLCLCLLIVNGTLFWQINDDMYHSGYNFQIILEIRVLDVYRFTSGRYAENSCHDMIFACLEHDLMSNVLAYVSGHQPNSSLHGVNVTVAVEYGGRNGNSHKEK